MNIIEETPGTFTIEVTGLSIRQIKEIFEDKWGGMVWSGGAAYPCDSVKLQFKNPNPAPKAEPVNQMLLGALREMHSVYGNGMEGFAHLDRAAAAIVAAEQAPQPAELTKPHCKECAQWRKAKADNAEWIEGVKRGREICEQLAAQGAKTE